MRTTIGSGLRIIISHSANAGTASCHADISKLCDCQSADQQVHHYTSILCESVAILWEKDTQAHSADVKPYFLLVDENEVIYSWS